MKHVPVMLEEVLEALELRPGGRYIDGTAGGGGHSEGLLDACGPDGRLLAIDRDPAAVERVKTRLGRFGERAMVVHGNFGSLAGLAAQHGFDGCDGVLLDLGVSSFQLDEAERGFSFGQDGPLDMRMDLSRGPTAADWLGTIEERELAEVLKEFGEERDARRVARQIVRARERGPILTTGQLAEIVERAKGGRRGRIHPATQTFQAIRIAVNEELKHVRSGVEAAIDVVRPGGRVAVLSFHSLEDRLVKQAFVAHAGRRESLAAGGDRWVGELPAVMRVTRKPRMASAEETETNPRSRSAKLRVVEREAERDGSDESA